MPNYVQNVHRKSVALLQFNCYFHVAKFGDGRIPIVRIQFENDPLRGPRFPLSIRRMTRARVLCLRTYYGLIYKQLISVISSAKVSYSARNCLQGSRDGTSAFVTSLCVVVLRFPRAPPNGSTWSRQN